MLLFPSQYSKSTQFRQALKKNLKKKLDKPIMILYDDVGIEKQHQRNEVKQNGRTVRLEDSIGTIS